MECRVVSFSVLAPASQLLLMLDPRLVCKECLAGLPLLHPQRFLQEHFAELDAVLWVVLCLEEGLDTIRGLQLSLRSMLPASRCEGCT